MTTGRASLSEPTSIEDRGTAAGTSHHKRYDIQGLRAIAVLSVVANHLTGWPGGGFVGVDVFFVVSGFLITGLLLRERDHAGRISFADFYRRRARRILPAAALVIASTVVASYALVNSAMGAEVLRDGGWALIFAANWHFAIVGTDYFQSDGISPLQHYWSLAVEEQFYLAWPIIIVTIFALVRSSRAARRVLLSATTALVVASFLYSMWHTHQAPTWAYFSTVDRAWELGVGALLAITAHRLARIPAVLAGIMGWVGVAAIGASFFLISETSTFPAPWSAMPVAGTALVLAAGVGHSQRHLVVLVNPLSRYVGDISYSLYLWHFPVIVLGGLLVAEGGLPTDLAILATMAVLSVLSYHLVEVPIRESAWLEPRNSDRRSQRRGTDPRRVQYAGLGVLVTIVAVLVALALQPVKPPPQTVTLPELDAASSTATLLDQQAARVEAALAQEDFPKFDPPLDQLGFEAWAAHMSEYGCTDVTEETAADCVFGPGEAPKTAVVLGDSYAQAWMPTVREALGEKWRIHQLTLGQCPTWDVNVIMWGGAAYPECEEFREWTHEQVDRLDPDLVILSSAYSTLQRIADTDDPDAAAQVAKQGLRQTLDRLASAERTMLVLAAPPHTGVLQECVTALASVDDCETSISAEWRTGSELEQAALSESSRGGTFVDVAPWFCQFDRCPAFVGSTPVAVDGNHLTIQYASSLGPLLAQAVRQASEGSD